jgi:hypothetical protein
VTTGLPAVLRGEARHPGGMSAAAIVTLDEEAIAVSVAGTAPWSAGYRDLDTVMVDGGIVMIQLGDGAGADRWLFERFGTLTGRLARGLRDGRLRQRLADGLVETDPDDEIDLVEYGAGAETGIAQLLYHERGVVLAPVDDRLAWRRIRRADIGGVDLQAAVGGVAIGSAGRSLATEPGGGPALRLLRLGPTAVKHRERWAALRDGAAADASAIVAGLVPDAPIGVRRAASAAMLEGRPTTPGILGEAWDVLETATLGHPPFDESYRLLREIGGGAEAAPRWLVAAPERPGNAEEPKLWFFVGLPGNLVAMELVSAGSHATYLFRVVPRAEFTGLLPMGALDAAVADVSEALIDARFLREPMALPVARLAEPAGLRYRLALASLPTLAAARARFVARVVHRDPESWRGAIEDLVAWHGFARDDAAEWPGRAAQEAQVDDAAGLP